MIKSYITDSNYLENDFNNFRGGYGAANIIILRLVLHLKLIPGVIFLLITHKTFIFIFKSFVFMPRA